MLCLIGESFDGESVIVNGAVVNVRNRVRILLHLDFPLHIYQLQGDKISMWLCETKPQESILKIGQTLKRRLGIDDKVVSYFCRLTIIVLIIFSARFFLDLNATMIPLTKLGRQPRANTASNMKLRKIRT